LVYVYVIAALFVMIIVVAVIQGNIEGNKLVKSLRAAWEAYQNALTQLKNEPNSHEIRLRALQCGRRYSDLTRNNSGVTIFDEVALKNDIDAACAGAVSIKTNSVEERLSTLQLLFASGHITDSEYQRRRQTILDSI